MKPLLLFILGLSLGYVWTTFGNTDTPYRSYGLGPYIEKMEIGCHARFPMNEDCKKSIVQITCKSDRMVERVQWAWNKWRDIDFILTVADESMWDENAVGDSGRAFGYCQIRHDFNKWGYDRYKAMGTWQERLTECHRMYAEWSKKGIIGKRLFGYNRRHANKLNISCK